VPEIVPAGRADGCVGYVDRDQGEPLESRFAAIACAGTDMRNLEEERFDFALVRSGCRASAALVFKLSGIRLFIGRCCV
jgi:hypothetical protein